MEKPFTCTVCGTYLYPDELGTHAMTHVPPFKIEAIPEPIPLPALDEPNPDLAWIDPYLDSMTDLMFVADACGTNGTTYRELMALTQALYHRAMREYSKCVPGGAEHPGQIFDEVMNRWYRPIL